MRGFLAKQEAEIDYTPSEIALEINKEAAARVNERHLLTRGRLLFCVFAFVFTAVLTFLLTQNMRTTSAASASDFNAGNLISDSVMTDYTTMTASEIDSFLRSKCSHGNSCLYAQSADALSGDEGETAASIIYQAAQDYQINPQVLLVLLQKEQSLITGKVTETKLLKATGYGCPDTSACDSKYYGFKNQVRNAASLFRTVMNGGWSNYPIGNNYIAYYPDTSCGGSTVYVENLATSALYRYTPYQPNEAALNAGYGTGDSCSSYGNRNFVYYFTDWFGSTQGSGSSTYTGSIYLPDGVYNITSTEGLAITFSSAVQGQQAYLATNTNSTTQQYYFQRVDGDYYTITNVSSGLNLDITDGKSTVDSTPIQLYEDDGTCVQKWKITITDEKTYKITSACNGKALDVRGGYVGVAGTAVQIYTANGTKAQEWQIISTSEGTIETGTALNLVSTGGLALATENEGITSGSLMQIGIRHSGTSEQFVFERDQTGYYRITQVASGLSVDVVNAGTSNKTSVQLYASNSTCAQRWIATQNSNGSYTFTNACSGLALDIDDGKTSTNNRTVQIYSDNGTVAQQWTLMDPPEPVLAEGNYVIASDLGEALVIDVDGGTNANGTNIQVYGLNSTDAQKYTVTYDAETGYYTIMNTAFGRVIDVSNGGTTNGTNVQLWTSNGTCSQKWIIVQDDDGDYNILSSCSRLALDVSGGVAATRTNVQIYTYNDTSAQKWSFVAVDEADSIRTVANGTYKLFTSLDTSYALDLDTTGGWRNGSNIQIYPASSNNSAQEFKITYQETTDYYIITNVGSGLALDVQNSNSASKVNVQGYVLDGTCAQNWTITKTSDGYYSFANACGSKMLDVQDGVVSNHQNVWVYTSNSTAAQKWVLQPV